MVGDPTEGALVVAAAKAGLLSRQRGGALPAGGRDPLRLRAQAHEHDPPCSRADAGHAAEAAPRRARAPLRRVRQGRARSSPRPLHRDPQRTGATTELTRRGRGAPSSGGERPSLPPSALRVLGRRLPALCGAARAARRRGPGERAHLPRSRRHDGPCPARSRPAVERGAPSGPEGDHGHGQTTARDRGGHRRGADRASSAEATAGRPLWRRRSTPWTTPGWPRRWSQARVFARVSPQHKVRIVEALQADGADRRDDRRRSERRPGPEARRHRHRHGDHGAPT